MNLPLVILASWLALLGLSVFMHANLFRFLLPFLVIAGVAYLVVATVLAVKDTHETETQDQAGDHGRHPVRADDSDVDLVQD